MAVRRMQAGEVEEVSRIAVSAFVYSVADGLSKQGISTFMKLSSPDAIASRAKGDNLLFVHDGEGGLDGMLELKEGRHIALLFVCPHKQRSGIGRELMQAAVRYCRSDSVTVSASLPSVGAYRKYGFEITGPEAEEYGLRYRPMSKKLMPGNGDGVEHP